MFIRQQADEGEVEIAWMKIDNLKTAGSEKWESIKKKLDTMLGDIEDAYRKAVSRVK
jgi:hypothetical protein